MRLSLRRPNLLHALGSLFFPHLCPGCGEPLLTPQECICPECLSQFPATGFAAMPDNVVERLFWGRISVKAAASLYFFTRDSRLQGVLHALKYGHDKASGHLLGRRLGESLLASGRFPDLDAILPMPLHPRKERLRGYNQSAVIAEGVAAVTGIPVRNGLLIRQRYTRSQTRKLRLERWENVADAFALPDPAALQGLRILLVDDVVTTGSSLEACAAALQSARPAGLWMATIASADR